MSAELEPGAGVCPPTCWLCSFCSLIASAQNSVGLEAWGYKYYFVFVVWDVCASILWFLFCVETRGRTLEELDEVFNQPWPAMASARRRKIAFTRTVHDGREYVAIIEDRSS